MCVLHNFTQKSWTRCESIRFHLNREIVVEDFFLSSSCQLCFCSFFISGWPDPCTKFLGFLSEPVQKSTCTSVSLISPYLERIFASFNLVEDREMNKKTVFACPQKIALGKTTLTNSFESAEKKFRHFKKSNKYVYWFWGEYNPEFRTHNRRQPFFPLKDDDVDERMGKEKIVRKKARRLHYTRCIFPSFFSALFPLYQVNQQHFEPRERNLCGLVIPLLAIDLETMSVFSIYSYFFCSSSSPSFRILASLLWKRMLRMDDETKNKESFPS